MEVKKIIGNAFYKENNNCVTVQTNNTNSNEELERLTFFSEVLIRNNGLTTSIIPRQVKYELSGKFLKRAGYNNQRLFEFITNGTQTSRQLRYLTHLMHEYKGRYNPQLCKVLMNMSGIKKREIVLDPFVGSGTTLVECFLNGFSAIGLDINPISYLITRAKIDSFSLDIKILKHILQGFADNLTHSTLNDSNEIITGNIANELKLDLDYLKSWFPVNNLTKVFYILQEINKLKQDKVKNLFFTALSDILRRISYQDPDQLRIGRRPEKEVEKNVFEIYLQKLNFYFKILEIYQFVKPSGANQDIKYYLGDARFLKRHLNLNENSIDLIVTSPPYATALPYIDTDRLSLFFLGYTNREDYRKLEKLMIGNREITKKEKEQVEIDFLANYNELYLPKEIKSLIKKIHLLNTNANVGFRRKNMAALLYKYFKDMQLSMKEMTNVLKRGKYCFMVVGCNNTIAGGQNVFIPTDDFIGLIGDFVGLHLEQKIPIAISQSYMIHRNNAIKRESILVFRKK
ncbi:MAG: DNA methyltransferase [Planctomycetota bacterium]|nr:DNA methyltransferase [Planctomycetota bacterium]